MKSLIAIPALMVALGSAAAQFPTQSHAVPAAICIKPDAPQLGPPGNDQSTINAYNAKIATYNRKSAAFSSCINTYVQNTNGEIQKIREDANARIKEITDSANSQTNDIDIKIRAAIAGTVLAVGPQTGFPSSECRKPDETLLKPANRKSDIAHTTRYDAQVRAYEPCVRTYMDQARGEIQQVQGNARSAIALVAEDANRRIALLNSKVSDASTTAGEVTREGAQTMDKVTALANAPGIASAEKTYPRPPRSADSPKGDGYPDAITCRAPQILPDSRLLGPEICRRNREWAQLYREGSDISADGLRIVDSERRRTQTGSH